MNTAPWPLVGFLAFFVFAFWRNARRWERIATRWESTAHFWEENAETSHRISIAVLSNAYSKRLKQESEDGIHPRSKS